MHAVLTRLLDRSALSGVRAEIEGLGLDVLEVCQLTRTPNHPPAAAAPATAGASLAPAHSGAQLGRGWAADDVIDAELRGESAFGHRPHDGGLNHRNAE